MNANECCILNGHLRSPYRVFKIPLTSAVICISRVLHGYEIVQYLQNFKRDVDQGYFRKLS